MLEVGNLSVIGAIHAVFLWARPWDCGRRLRNEEHWEPLKVSEVLDMKVLHVTSRAVKSHRACQTAGERLFTVFIR